MSQSTLVTAAASARSIGREGRAIVNARGHHLVCDSPPPLGGPNEELNPIEFLLGALAACAVFVCQRAAQEQSIPLDQLHVTVAADFDPRGVCGESIDPRLQSVRVRLATIGITPDQGNRLAAAFQSRCPVYTTLAASARMSVEVHLDAQPLGGVHMKVLRCADVGFDCAGVIKAETEDELLRQAAMHAQQVHQVVVTPEIVAKVRSVITTE